MKKLRILLSVLLWTAASAPLLAQAPTFKKTPLDDYVAKRDSTYGWKLVSTIKGDGFTTYVLDLKSQSWRKPPEVDRSVWQHWVTIVKPDVVKYDTAFLRIGGGANGGNPPARTSPQWAKMAKATNSVIADLGMVPNQPITF